MANRNKVLAQRRTRVRNKLKSVAGARPRLSVFRSSKHIYAQVIDDVAGRTLASASTIEAELRGKAKNDSAGAAEVGRLVAERAKAAGVTEVVFDRGAYIYHGRVKSLADAARENGLNF
ncbi:50S ribosomal protein L18 [Futiania mangrovi]|uniref:Large ribosomal subunit protein uL18 n=1 Tax=Futiania mangrovi TaxID=2959716 RepID=A0A9J6PBS3_9PROT|nr:50S ribosomal protein L18 [Futiania mangrovii]MCP1335200.1 50S ribosomal protein L18 [Futiania mangrovii]